MQTSKIMFTEPWGFSKLDAFRSCKRKFMLQFIKKVPAANASSPALDRGTAIHNEAEAFLKGWLQDLTMPLTDWLEPLQELRKKKAMPEAAWGFDRQWQPLPNWLAPTTWVRAKSDAHFLEDDVLTIIDFKSGKFRVPSIEQIELYAICGHAKYPHVKKVKAEFWFVDTGDVHNVEYTAEHLLLLRKKYEDYVAPMYTEEQWPATPSMGCKWCFDSKYNGGSCEF